MDLVDYVKLLRRRWQIPFVCLLLGAVLGWSTAPEPPEVVVRSGRFFEASHFLTFDAEAGAAWTSLDQLAFDVKVGEVSEEVSEELRIAVETVRRRVQGRPIPSANALEVVAIGESGNETARLANVAAEVLVRYANESVADRFDERFAELRSREETLAAQRDQLNAAFAAAGEAERSAIADELLVVENSLTQARTQLLSLIDQGEPGAVLSSRQAASGAVGISEELYREREAEFANPAGAGAALPADPDRIESEGDEGGMGARLRTILGGLLGLGAGIGIVLMLDRFDTRLRTKKEAEEHFGLPVIAEIPPLHRSQRNRAEIAVRTSPRSRLAESYRTVRTSILFVAASGARANAGESQNVPDTNAERSPSGAALPWLREERGEGLTVLVTSPGPEEGKTSTTANLAALLAESGMRVLVVNCDYRRPRIHKYFEGQEVATPSSQSAEAFDVAKGARIIDTAVPGVRLVTGIGEHDPEANPAQVVVAQRKVIQVARRHFDVILLDTAPLLTTNDAVEILSEADLVVLTCRYGRTKSVQADLAGELLERLGAPVVGVVFIESPEAPQAQYYYYYLDPGNARKERRQESRAEADRAAANAERAAAQASVDDEVAAATTSSGGGDATVGPAGSTDAT